MSPLGYPRLHLRSTDSTNDRARELAQHGAPDGTLVTAASQTAGRGRQGRRWEAPAGSSVLMSLVVREPPPLLPLLAALAVCDLAGEGAMIKWPNDVVLADDPRAGAEPVLTKVAGILTEGRPQEGWAVLGIGVNVAISLDELPDELRAGPALRAGALPAGTLGRARAEVEPALAELLAALELRLAQDPHETLSAWRARDALEGRTIAWSGGSGVARSVDGLGRLVVELDGGGRTELSAGEVHLRLGGDA